MRMSLLVILSSFAAACGGGKSDAENFADNYCAEVAKCCAKAGMSGSGSVCRMAYSGGTYNASAGDACLAEVKSRVAAGTFCTNEDTSATCKSAITYDTKTGNKKPGETCEVAGDCAPSGDGKVVCASRYSDGTWTNKCQVRIRGKAGDACLGTQDGDVFSSTNPGSDIPASGYVCDTADDLTCSPSGTCTALLTIGQACHYASDCVRSAYCDSKSRCSARISAGGTCTGADDECVAGHYCPAEAPRQCSPQLPTGSDCTAGAMCRSGNCEGSICKPNLLDNFGWAIFCS